VSEEEDGGRHMSSSRSFWSSLGTATFTSTLRRPTGWSLGLTPTQTIAAPATRHPRLQRWPNPNPPLLRATLASYGGLTPTLTLTRTTLTLTLTLTRFTPLSPTADGVYQTVAPNPNHPIAPNPDLHPWISKETANETACPPCPGPTVPSAPSHGRRLQVIAPKKRKRQPPKAWDSDADDTCSCPSLQPQKPAKKARVWLEQSLAIDTAHTLTPPPADHPETKRALQMAVALCPLAAPSRGGYGVDGSTEPTQDLLQRSLTAAIFYGSTFVEAPPFTAATAAVDEVSRAALGDDVPKPHMVTSGTGASFLQEQRGPNFVLMTYPLPTDAHAVTTLAAFDAVLRTLTPTLNPSPSPLPKPKPKPEPEPEPEPEPAPEPSLSLTRTLTRCPWATRGRTPSWTSMERRAGRSKSCTPA